MAIVNGEKKECTGQTLTQLIEDMGYDIRHIAAEVNEAIISKDNYASTVINDDDIVEIVTFMGGGQ